MKKNRLGKNDIRLILILVAIALICGLVIHFVAGKSGSQVVITVDGDEYGTYSLMKNQEIPIIIDGVTTNVVTVENGHADMTDADCPDKLCVHQSAISRTNQTIVCLPNKVVVRVIGGNSGAYDSIAR